jgi:Fur family ferric uptake transcriptional regulator
MDQLAAKETLEKFLRERNLRPTRERLLLMEEVMRTDGHFDADSLFASLSRRGLKASRATVYNTLDLLVQSGLISRYRFGENHSRYEKAFGKPRHDHMICLACGEILEFVSKKLEHLQQEVCEEMRFSMEHSTLQIFGRCRVCLDAKKSAAGSSTGERRRLHRGKQI